jgi:hypothetical protein
MSEMASGVGGSESAFGSARPYQRQEKAERHPLPVNVSIGLPPRVANALLNAGIETFEELATLTDAELLSVPQLGYSALEDIRRTLRLLAGAQLNTPAPARLTDGRTALERELWDLTAPAGGSIERGMAMMHFGWDGRLSVEEIRNRYRVRRDLLRRVFLAVETQPVPAGTHSLAIRRTARFVAAHTPMWIPDAEKLLGTTGLTTQHLTISGLLIACRIAGVEPGFGIARTPRELVVELDRLEDCRVVVRSVQHLAAIRGTTTIDEVRACAATQLGRSLDRRFVRRSIALLDTVQWLDPKLGIVSIPRRTLRAVQTD